MTGLAGDAGQPNFPKADFVSAGPLQIARVLFNFIETEALPGSGVDSARFWEGLSALLARHAPANRALLARRDELQAAIDKWHLENPGIPDAPSYEAFLRGIGYLEAEPPPFQITASDVDDEIALTAGPQLVVPLTNPRYALNAANARWGSLYDALYGTDALPEAPDEGRAGAYNRARGAKVIAYARAFLDETFPLVAGSHAEAKNYAVDNGALTITLAGGKQTALADESALIGFAGSAAAPDRLLLRHNGLHVELVFNAEHPIGREDPARLADIQMESALTSIMDGEDSVATVDAADKVVVYRHWLLLMQGVLTATFDKAGGKTTRRLAPDRAYVTPSGERVVLPGRALMMARNVGLHLMTDAVRDASGAETPENILDIAITALTALHDIRAPEPRNSRARAIYIVRPKMHGPAEVAFANALFADVEDMLGLAPNTIKMGVMDEERRTSANLAACIAAARDRIIFINTGFLDRTGDEIHTSMLAGPIAPKNDIKLLPWIGAYETRNVAIGLACGFAGRAQIGKGMWAAPDKMADMLAQKIGHPQSGANAAWVPSPTAATLHALHYHKVNVQERQAALAGRALAPLSDLLTPPLASQAALDATDKQRELDNNCQGILGYVVRWIDQGVGCSKVPDINDVGLMEDRATLRISSQHIANWMRHGIISTDDVMNSLRRMAAIVDRQNAAEPGYLPMAPGFDGAAFTAACDLIFKGAAQPNGYTEFLLTVWRRRAK